MKDNIFVDTNILVYAMLANQIGYASGVMPAA